MQTLACHEVERFCMFSHRRHRQSMKQIQGFLTMRQIAAGELLNYKRMG